MGDPVCRGQGAVDRPSPQVSGDTLYWVLTPASHHVASHVFLFDSRLGGSDPVVSRGGSTRLKVRVPSRHPDSPPHPGPAPNRKPNLPPSFSAGSGPTVHPAA